MFLVLGQQLRTQSSPCNIHKVFLELSLILRIIFRNFFEAFQSFFTRQTPAGNDLIGMNFLLQEFFTFSKEFPAENSYGSCSVTNCFILGFWNLCKGQKSGKIRDFFGLAIYRLGFWRQDCRRTWSGGLWLRRSWHWFSRNRDLRL